MIVDRLQIYYLLLVFMHDFRLVTWTSGMLHGLTQNEQNLLEDHKEYGPQMTTVNGPKILIVDDLVENIEVLKETLREEYTILEATSGDQALQEAARSLPDLILLDAIMPGMDGFETCRRLKQTRKLREIPVIFVTGLTDIADEAKGFAAGGVDYITKPISPPIVSARVATHLRLKSTETQLRDTLQKTLSGAVSLLMDLLTMTNPVAYSRAARLRRYVKLMSPHLDQPGSWQFELAATFSQVGCLQIPPEILEDIYAGRVVEDSNKALFDLHPQAGSDFVGRIPNLENVAAIIAQQSDDVEPPSGSAENGNKIVSLGATLLRTIIEYDRLVSTGLPRDAALRQLRANPDKNDPDMIAALEKGLQSETLSAKPRLVSASLLLPGYVLQNDAFSTSGKLLLKTGTELSCPMVQSLQRIAAQSALVEPLLVLTPD